MRGHCGPSRLGRALLCCLSFATWGLRAQAEDAASSLVLVEPAAARPRQLACVAHLTTELRVLGFAVQRSRARTTDLPEALRITASADLATCAGERAAACADRMAAALDCEEGRATLLFVSVANAELSSYALGGPDANDPTTVGQQAAEVLRAQLRERALWTTAQREAASPAPAAAAAPPAAAKHDAAAVEPRADDPELPPLLQPVESASGLALDSGRLSGALGFGLLTSDVTSRPQAILSLLASARLTRLLRAELLALVPLHAGTHPAKEVRIDVRASLLGIDLRVALYSHPRWDVSVAFGAALAIVAYHRSDEPRADRFTRSLGASALVRLGSGIRLNRVLSLQLDFSAGTLIDPVHLRGASGSAPSWGSLWVAGALALGAALP